MTPLRAFAPALLAQHYTDAASVARLCADVGAPVAPEAPGDADDRWKRTLAPLDETQVSALFEAASRAHPESVNTANIDALHRASDLMLGVDAMLQRHDLAAVVDTLERSLAIHETVFGPRAARVCAILESLAMVRAQRAEWPLVAAILERALSIEEALFGAESPDTVDTRRRLASALSQLRRYDRAEALVRSVLTSLERAKEPDEEALATVLRDLGRLFVDQGDRDRARPLFERALAIRERIHERGSGPISQSLTDLADLDVDAGDFARAQPLYARALADLDARFGPENPGSAHAALALARFHHRREDYDLAQPLYERALRFYKGSPIYPARARISPLDSLAMLHHARGAYDVAEALEREARAVLETLTPAERLGSGQLATNLALTCVSRGRVAEALPLLMEALTDAESVLRAMLRVGTEARVQGFLLKGVDVHHAAAALALLGAPEAWRLALAAMLLRKGRSLDEAALLQGSASPTDPAMRTLVERLRALRGELATRTLAGPGRTPPETHRTALRALSDQAESIAQTLADRSAEARAARTPPDADVIVSRVASALAPDAALVEVSLAQPWDFTARSTRLAEPEHHYLAVVLHPDGEGVAVDLGPQAPIDAAIAALLRACTPDDPRAPGADEAARAAGEALYALVLRPLEEHLRGKTRVLLSLDGDLQLVPFAALHDGRTHLVERYAFTHLSSGRDLVPPVAHAPSKRGVVAFADPDFTAQISPPTRGEKRSLRGLTFGALPRLPGTAVEARAIARLFPGATIYTGSEATERALLSVDAPAVLHVATHGLFLDGASAVASSRHAKVVDDEAPPEEALDPLLRSALVMAGARARRVEGSPEDAIATALEVAGMNLRGTQLVVLSACDTGRGDVRVGDGVHGLRRAAVLAGAETLVMSLWHVDDAATCALMEGYYTRLARGEGRASALRDAVCAVRAAKPHPYFWAPFVLLGRSEPLALDDATP